VVGVGRRAVAAVTHAVLLPSLMRCCYLATEKIVNLETGGQTVQESSLPVEEAEEFDTADELVPEDRGRDSQ